jgi:hypothetical protein
MMEDEVGRPAVGAAVEGEARVLDFQEELVGRLGEELGAGLARGLAEEAVPLAGEDDVDDVEARGQAIGADQAVQDLRGERHWKLWGNSVGMLDWRTDLQNLPPERASRWPGAGYGLLEGHDPASGPSQPAIHVTLLHGVRASLELQRTGDRKRALEARNPEVAPHLSFTDLGGHGYAVVKAGGEELEVEFVCVERPLERSDRPDGGPLAYRIAHRAKRWAPGAAPRLERGAVEGELPLVLG